MRNYYTKRVGFDTGTKIPEKGYKHKGKLKRLYKEIIGKDRSFRDQKDAELALTPTDVGAKFVKGLKKKGIDHKKILQDIKKEKMKSY